MGAGPAGVLRKGSIMRATAAIAHGNGTFTLDDVEIGGPEAGEVLVGIRASGVCHTDHKMLPLGPERIMGHEGAGVVLEIGQGVRNVMVGDRVALNWAMPCGNCA